MYSEAKEALPLLPREGLLAPLGELGAPRLRPDLDGGAGRRGGPVRRAVRVRVQKPARVHNAAQAHVSTAQLGHQLGHRVEVDQDAGTPGAAARQVQLLGCAQLLPGKQFTNHFFHNLGAEEGEP